MSDKPHPWQSLLQQFSLDFSKMTSRPVGFIFIKAWFSRMLGAYFPSVVKGQTDVHELGICSVCQNQNQGNAGKKHQSWRCLSLWQMEQYPVLASSSHQKQACETQAGSGSQKHVTELAWFYFLSPLLFLRGNLSPRQSEKTLLKTREAGCLLARQDYPGARTAGGGVRYCHPHWCQELDPPGYPRTLGTSPCRLPTFMLMINYSPQDSEQVVCWRSFSEQDQWGAEHNCDFRNPSPQSEERED